MRVPLPLGEVIDRITILRLKVARIHGPGADAAREHLQALQAAWADEELPDLRHIPHARDLADVNARLWDTEDEIRRLDAAGDHGDAYVAAARRVHHLNDERARLKARLDAQLGSEFTDPKSYGSR